MNIEDSRAKTIYRKDGEGYTLYSIGINHKKQDGSWEGGFIPCRFPKGTNIPNKTKIMMITAWLDFYTKEEKTHPFIYIKEYEIVEDKQESKQENIQVPQNAKTEYDNENTGVSLSDDDLPF